jgi:hypothetical protein
MDRQAPMCCFKSFVALWTSITAQITQASKKINPSKARVRAKSDPTSKFGKINNNDKRK